jgi:hypothetical protein
VTQQKTEVPGGTVLPTICPPAQGPSKGGDVPGGHDFRSLIRLIPLPFCLPTWPAPRLISHRTRLGAASTLATEPTNIIAGIDTHADTHHVAVINEHGKPLADKEFLAVGSGYRKIVDFITSYGTVTAVGVEGTGSYGAEIARTLRGEGLCVLEVNRPNRAARRLKGKSDPLDAYQAAQSVLDGRTNRSPRPKTAPLNACEYCVPAAHRQ